MIDMPFLISKKKDMTRLFVGFLLMIVVLDSSCTNQESYEEVFTEETIIDLYDYLHDFEPIRPNGMANVVIEIPAGSNQKWEVDKITGFLEWEISADTLRTISYLPYPANYGMVPRTLLPIEDGGDDDPIDIFVLGLSVDRGSVIPARVVGVIKMLDDGEQDDKLIAVDPESWLYHVHTLNDLERSYPGVTQILAIWLENYKGGNRVQIQGIENEIEANAILMRAIEGHLNRDQ